MSRVDSSGREDVDVEASSLTGKVVGRAERMATLQGNAIRIQEEDGTQVEEEEDTEVEETMVEAEEVSEEEEDIMQ